VGVSFLMLFSLLALRVASPWLPRTYIIGCPGMEVGRLPVRVVARVEGPALGLKLVREDELPRRPFVRDDRMCRLGRVLIDCPGGLRCNKPSATREGGTRGFKGPEVGRRRTKAEVADELGYLARSVCPAKAVEGRRRGMRVSIWG